MCIQRWVGIAFLVISILGLIAGLSGGTALQESIAPVVIFAIIGIVLLVKKPKTKEEKLKAKEDKESLKEYHKSHFRVQHVAGLPMPQGFGCSIAFEEDKITIDGGGNTYRVDSYKITSVDTKSDFEIQKQYVSSAGGAVGGALLFGPLGAIVGGRAKEKKTTVSSHYLIITYKKDQQIDYISFEIQFAQVARINKILSNMNYSAQIGNTEEIEL